MKCDFAHISVQKCISATFWPLHFSAWSKYHFRTKFVERFNIYKYKKSFFSFFSFSLLMFLDIKCDFVHISVQKCISATFWLLHFPACSKYHFRTKFVECFIEKLDIFIFEISRSPVCPAVCSSEKIVHLWYKSSCEHVHATSWAYARLTPTYQHIHASVVHMPAFSWACVCFSWARARFQLNIYMFTCGILK